MSHVWSYGSAFNILLVALDQLFLFGCREPRVLVHIALRRYRELRLELAEGLHHERVMAHQFFILVFTRMINRSALILFDYYHRWCRTIKLLLVVNALDLWDTCSIQIFLSIDIGLVKSAQALRFLVTPIIWILLVRYKESDFASIRFHWSDPLIIRDLKGHLFALVFFLKLDFGESVVHISAKYNFIGSISAIVRGVQTVLCRGAPLNTNSLITDSIQ